MDEFIAQGVDSLILPGFMDLAEIKVLRESTRTEAGSPLILYRIDSEHAHSKFSSLQTWLMVSLFQEKSDLYG